MANARTKTTTRVKKKDTEKKVPESQTIKAAFRRASMGRTCTICNRRLENSVYQRHYENCKLPDENEDDEIIFCGIVQSERTVNTSEIATKIEEKNTIRNLKREASSNPSTSFIEKTIPTKKILSTLQSETVYTISDESVSFLEDVTSTSTQSHLPSTSPTKENISKEYDNSSAAYRYRVDALTLFDVYNMCLLQLENFVNEQQFSLTTESNLNEIPTGSNNKHNTADEGAKKYTTNFPHYSLRYLWKILLTVLRCPEHENLPEMAIKFWRNSLRVLLAFLNLSIKAQQLFSRMFLRRWGWNIAQHIKYKELGNDLMPHFLELQTLGFMENGIGSGKIMLDESLKLLGLEDLQPICKKLLINPTIGKQSIIKELKKYATQKNVYGFSNERNLFKCIKNQVNEFFRIPSDVFDLFTAILTIYSPNLMDTSQLIQNATANELSSQLMFIILQKQSGQLSFTGPACPAHSLVSSYADSEELSNFISAKNYEQKIINLNIRNAYDEIISLVKTIIEMFFRQSDVTNPNENTRDYSQVPLFLRKFTPSWIYCRCIFHGVEAAQRLRNYSLAVDWLKLLLERQEFQSFCINERGKWYHRLALNTETYLKNSEAAVRICIAGLKDSAVGAPDKLTLQNRLQKLLGRLDDVQIHVTEPENVNITGRKLAKGLGDGIQVNHFYVTPSSLDHNGVDDSNTRNSDNDKCSCSVENLALLHFIQKQGYTEGTHAEGQIWHTIFRLFFHDIIYCTNITASNVWISSLQSDPLDLNYPDFYANRQQMIDHRLNQILNFTADALEVFVYEHFDCVKTNLAPNSIVGWHHFKDSVEILRFLHCCSTKLLYALFKRLCMDFRFTRSGFPDLTLWNAQKRTLAVVEVKGPNDQLSTKQQLWLDFFQKQGVRAAVCYVSAKSDRALE